MASMITVKIKYDDNSRSQTESWPCADPQPSVDVIRHVVAEAQLRWEDTVGSLRGTETHVTVKRQ